MEIVREATKKVTITAAAAATTVCTKALSLYIGNWVKTTSSPPLLCLLCVELLYMYALGSIDNQIRLQPSITSYGKVYQVQI